MIVTVLWEDSRGSGFAPGKLVDGCLRDRIGFAKFRVLPEIKHLAKKGRDNVIAALGDAHLAKQPRLAVLDWDRIHDRWPGEARVACKKLVAEKVLAEAKGAPKVVFLVNNMESLVDACCDALRHRRPDAKLQPMLRDELIERAVQASSDVRRQILQRCPSFGRIVDRVAALLSGLH